MADTGGVVEVNTGADTDVPAATAVLSGPAVSDMILLDELTEEAMLANLRARFEEGLIYTSISSIVVAVNPFEQHDHLYTDEMASRYAARAGRKRTLHAVKAAQANNATASNPTDGENELPPHVYSIASSAYYHAVKNGATQAIVISGESGAGKTETAKLILNFIAFASKQTHGADYDMNRRIVQANPVIEAFGNAKTVRNNNSSRFGKLVSVQLTAHGTIASGKLVNYLLEKSRVVKQQPGERNFHVFYQLAASAASQSTQPSEVTALLQDLPHTLCEARGSHFLRQGNTMAIEGVDDAADFVQTCRAMEVLQIDDQNQRLVFRALAAVLQIGNVSFVDAHTDAGDTVAIEDSTQSWLNDAAALLSLDSKVLESVLLTRRMGAGGGRSVVTVQYTQAQAADARDALAKQLYAHIFDWLIAQVNAALKASGPDDSVMENAAHILLPRITDVSDGGASPRGGDSFRSSDLERAHQMSIDVLDIFGFEIFEHNSFEQLCINYCNQKLQCYFDTHIFKLEQEEYLRQGVEVPPVEAIDNEMCLELLEQRRAGIFSMLDEEINIPNGSEVNLLAKMSRVHADHPNFSKNAKGGSSTFTILHYAGAVTYEIDGFLDKNKDLLHNDIAGCLRSSSEPFVRLLFAEGGGGFRRHSSVVQGMGADSVVPPTSSRRGVQRRQKGDLTLSSKFKKQLASLMQKLTSAEPHFIRCLKPNNSAEAKVFERETMLAQMRCAGLQQVCEVRRVGYPVRVTFDEFEDRFCRVCAQKSADTAKLCESLVSQGVLIDAQWARGRDKMFFSHRQMQMLDRFEDTAHLCSMSIARCVRRVIAKRRQQKRIELLQTLSAAVERRDLEAAEKMVSTCSETLPYGGLHLSAVQAAHKILPRLAEEAKLKAALADAIEQRSLEGLRAAVAAAAELDPPFAGAVVTQACKLLERVEREATFDSDLSAAIQRCKHGELSKMLVVADELEMRTAQVQQARDLLQKLEGEALRAVHTAIADRSLVDLQQAIHTLTDMGLDVDDDAQTTLESLQKQEVLAEQLRQACAEQSVESIQSILTASEDFDLIAPTLAEERKGARALLTKLEELSVLQLRLSPLLRESTAACDFARLGELKALLADAHALGFGNNVTATDGPMSQVFAKASSQCDMFQQQHDAVAALAAAVGTNVREELEPAIARAEALSFDHPTLQRAKKLLDIIVRQKEVGKLLAVALSGKDIEAVRAAVTDARQVELEDTPDGIAGRRMLIDVDLLTAVGRNELGDLETVVAEAAALGHDNENVQRARDALEKLRREAEVRAEQKKQQNRIAEAETHGLDSGDEQLAKAKQLAKDLVRETELLEVMQVAVGENRTLAASLASQSDSGSGGRTTRTTSTTEASTETAVWTTLKKLQDALTEYDRLPVSEVSPVYDKAKTLAEKLRKEKDALDALRSATDAQMLGDLTKALRSATNLALGAHSAVHRASQRRTDLLDGFAQSRSWMNGTLYKRGGGTKKTSGTKFKKRWFQLEGVRLMYFAKEGDETELGYIALRDVSELKESSEASAGGLPSDAQCFELVTPSRTWVFAAENKSLHRDWLLHLRRVHQASQLTGEQKVSGLTKEGMLSKRGHLVKNWKSRWIVLRNGKLQYFAKQNGELKGEVSLIGSNPTIEPVASKGKGYIFRVEAHSDAETSGHQREELYLRSDTEAERDEWLAAIDAAWIGQHGSTALIVAAQHNDVPAVQRLCNAGANVNHRDEHGTTALMVAAELGHDNVIEILLQAKADVNLQTMSGVTAITYAADKGLAKCVDVLIQAGADVNVQNLATGDTLAMLATRHHTKHHAEVLRLLADASADFRLRNNHGKNVFQVGVSHFGESPTSAFLRSMMPAVVTQPPLTMKVRFGDRVEISVVATGQPLPTYQWQKDGIDVRGATTSTLTIENVSKGDAGFYICHISNPHDSINSASTQLTCVPGDSRGLAPVTGADGYAQHADDEDVMVALERFSGDLSQHQLSFAEGELIAVIDKYEGGWWWAADVDGQEGYVPEDFLTDCVPPLADDEYSLTEVGSAQPTSSDAMNSSAAQSNVKHNVGEQSTELLSPGDAKSDVPAAPVPAFLSVPAPPGAPAPPPPPSAMKATASSAPEFLSHPAPAVPASAMDGFRPKHAGARSPAQARDKASNSIELPPADPHAHKRHQRVLTQHTAQHVGVGATRLQQAKSVVAAPTTTQGLRVELAGTLHILLCDQNIAACFSRQLTDSFGKDNVEFFTAVEDFRAAPSTSLAELNNEIWERFFSVVDEADEAQRFWRQTQKLNQIAEVIRSQHVAKPSMYDAAQAEVLDILANSFLHRFNELSFDVRLEGAKDSAALRVLSFQGGLVDKGRTTLVITDPHNDAEHLVSLSELLKVSHGEQNATCTERKSVTLTVRGEADQTQEYCFAFLNAVESSMFCTTLYVCQPGLDIQPQGRELKESTDEKSRYAYQIHVKSHGTFTKRTLVIDEAAGVLEWEKKSLTIQDLQISFSSTNSKKLSFWNINQGETGSRLATLMFADRAARERFAAHIRYVRDGANKAPRGLKVHTCTWNVGDSEPPSDTALLSRWLPPQKHDIYAIGMQECSKKDAWMRALVGQLNVKPRGKTVADDEYVVLATSNLWDIHLLVIIRSTLSTLVTKVESDTVATGIGGILGNKGGAAVGFVFDESTRLAFFTSHLAARATRLRQRAENFADIVSGMKLGGPLPGTECLHQFHHVFWVGDLNYRIDFGQHGTQPEFENTKELIAKGELEQLIAHDQLAHQRGAHNVFSGFEEGPITFPPTYRMLKNKEGYSNKKFQNPSYTDRVLWRSGAGTHDAVRLTKYAAVFELNNSDHRPLFSSFDVTAEKALTMSNTAATALIPGTVRIIVAFLHLKMLPAPPKKDKKKDKKKKDKQNDKDKDSLNDVTASFVSTCLKETVVTPKVGKITGVGASDIVEDDVHEVFGLFEDDDGTIPTGALVGALKFLGVDQQEQETMHALMAIGTKSAESVSFDEFKQLLGKCAPPLIKSKVRRGAQAGHARMPSEKQTADGSVVGSTASSKWEWDNDVILTPVAAEQEWLSRQSVLVVLRRENGTGPVVGQVEIPCTHLMQTGMIAPEHFFQPVYMHGRVVGTLSGSLLLQNADHVNSDGDRPDAIKSLIQWHDVINAQRHTDELKALVRAAQLEGDALHVRSQSRSNAEDFADSRGIQDIESKASDAATGENIPERSSVSTSVDAVTQQTVVEVKVPDKVPLPIEAAEPEVDEARQQQLQQRLAEAKERVRKMLINDALFSGIAMSDPAEDDMLADSDSEGEEEERKTHNQFDEADIFLRQLLEGETPEEEAKRLEEEAKKKQQLSDAKALMQRLVLGSKAADEAAADEGDYDDDSSETDDESDDDGGEHDGEYPSGRLKAAKSDAKPASRAHDVGGGKLPLPPPPAAALKAPPPPAPAIGAPPPPAPALKAPPPPAPAIGEALVPVPAPSVLPAATQALAPASAPAQSPAPAPAPAPEAAPKPAPKPTPPADSKDEDGEEESESESEDDEAKVQEFQALLAGAIGAVSEAKKVDAPAQAPAPVPSLASSRPAAQSTIKPLPALKSFNNGRYKKRTRQSNRQSYNSYTTRTSSVQSMRPQSSAPAPLASLPDIDTPSYKVYPLAVLQSSESLPKDVDAKSREQHLSDEDFFELFEMNKLEWQALPQWKKTSKKKAAKLF